MRKQKAYTLVLGLFIFSSLLAFAKPAVASEDSATETERLENDDRLEKNSRDSADEREDDATSSPKRSDEDKQEDKTSTNTPRDERGESESELHRSTVATFVQNLLKVGEKRKDGIGEQVREIAKEQEDDMTSTTQAIKETEDRGKLKTFLIGTDYKNIGAIRSTIVKTRNQIEQLNRTIENLPTSTEKIELENELKNLQQQQTRLDNFVKSKESAFSLFGWFVKLFYK